MGAAQNNRHCNKINNFTLSFVLAELNLNLLKTEDHMSKRSKLANEWRLKFLDSITREHTGAMYVPVGRRVTKYSILIRKMLRSFERLGWIKIYPAKWNGRELCAVVALV